MGGGVFAEKFSVDRTATNQCNGGKQELKQSAHERSYSQKCDRMQVWITVYFGIYDEATRFRRHCGGVAGVDKKQHIAELCLKRIALLNVGLCIAECELAAHPQDEDITQTRYIVGTDAEIHIGSMS